MSSIRSLTLGVLVVGASLFSLGNGVLAQSPTPSSGPMASPGGQLPLPPDGTWESRLTIEELRAAGATEVWTQDGVFQWTFADGKGRVQVTWADGSTEVCQGPLEAIAVDVIRVHEDCGDDDIGWSLDADGRLHLRFLNTEGPYVAVNRAYLEAKPWVRVDGSEPSGPPPSPLPSGA